MSARFTRDALIARPPGVIVGQGEVPFHHVDAAGIVFYARVFDWLHDGYVAFLARSGFPLADAIRRGAWMAPLVHAHADYLSPLRFGDPITTEVVDAETSEHRVSLGYRVKTGDRVAVVGSTVHVFVDPNAFERAPMPKGLRAAFDAVSR